jgi:DtxR family Mn-dependent transcriptional regulator
MKLMAMGLYPGATIELMRRRPSFVYRSGYSEFAIDRELAALVMLRLEDEAKTS